MGCARCGALALPSAHFCDVCGTPLIPTGVIPVGLANTGGAAWRAPMAARTPMPRSAATVACTVLVPVAGLSAVIAGIATFASDRPAVVVLMLAALVCMGGAVGELLGMRELLRIGSGTAMALGAAAAVRAAELLFAWDAAPPVAVLAWIVVALVAPVLIVLIAAGGLPLARATEPPIVFPAVALGSGLLCTVALILPGSTGALAGLISADQPVVTLFVVLYAAAPALAGAAAMAARNGATHATAFGAAAWFLLDWAAKGVTLMRERALFLFAAAGLIWALSTVGGGLLQWHAGVPHFEKPRDYALPISAAGAVLLVMLTGLLG